VIEVSSADPADIPEIVSLAAASLPQPWPTRVFEKELRLAEARLWVAKEEARSIAFWLRVGSSMKSTSSPSPSLRHSAGAAWRGRC
jgi:hypothetical protein